MGIVKFIIGSFLTVSFIFPQSLLAITNVSDATEHSLIADELIIDSSRLSAQSAFQLRHFQQLVDENDWVSAGEVFEKVRRVEDRRGE